MHRILTDGRVIYWSKGHEFLDKELQHVVRDAELGRRYADKLVKVFTHDGAETWVLVHVEVQGTAEGAPFSRAELEKLLDLAQAGIARLVSAQKLALGLA